MRARYYEPGSGRFLSEDPALCHSNWFVYCSNMPQSLSDTSGCDDNSDRERARQQATFMLSVMFFLLGAVLIGVMVDAKLRGPASALSSASRWWSEIAKIELTYEDMSVMQKLIAEAKKFAGSGKGSAGGAVLALIGMDMIWKSLLIDIDNAADGGIGGIDVLYG